MTSPLATNSLVPSDRLLGYKNYLEASYEEPSYPIERQIPQTITTNAPTVGVHTNENLPRENIWVITTDLSAGSVTFNLNAVNVNNMVGRCTTLVFDGVPDLVNFVRFNLPAGYNWVATGLATGLVQMTLPVNTASVINIYWADNGRVLLNGNLAGYSFA